jgi:hypothetical protein
MRDDEPMTDEPLARSLHAAVAALRAEREVPELWRARLLHEVRHSAETRRRRRRILLGAAVVMVVVAGSIVLGASDRARPAVTSAAAGRVAAPLEAAPVRFSVDAPGARRVALVGDFDAWTPNGRPMRRSDDGHTWELSVALPPGRHAFAYLVDGVLRTDPTAARAVEDDFGVPSSVIVIASRGT